MCQVLYFAEKILGQNLVGLWQQRYPRHCFSLHGLVHICIPHPYTPCGRGLYRQGLTRLSWGLPLRFCLASLIYILIISQGWRFVKRFSQKIPDFFDYLRYSSPQSTCSCPGVTRRTYSSFALALAVGLDLTLRVCFQPISVLSPQPGSPLDTLIVSQLGRFVKGFFHSSVMGLEPLGSDASLQPRLLTFVLYHKPFGLSIPFL